MCILHQWERQPVLPRRRSGPKLVQTISRTAVLGEVLDGFAVAHLMNGQPPPAAIPVLHAFRGRVAASGACASEAPSRVTRPVKSPSYYHEGVRKRPG